eukprot:CAMPEP_0118698470 /NCGR_PEP_ID=MMETSP0800-20121206/15223_1 /TAXON_ID=210618 ORGANISM="Striatella unipunctata, Strain CCMP2910" /NCGR_SAMPLE_ID=MMETSP0800 /ASSEMBLY_ACC=CAM_ASM_000638 /LENGTH=455 /DNA_ID=CAMNT_0006598303 /DNA_START=145 /DNA_END=1513 /DNA_ORIENTATION=+
MALTMGNAGFIAHDSDAMDEDELKLGRNKFHHASKARELSPQKTLDNVIVYGDDDESSTSNSDVYSAVTSTERWVSDLVSESEKGEYNPYVKRDANYVCETQSDWAMIVSSFFRHFKEAREGVEVHAKRTGGSKRYIPYRSSLLMIIPFNPELTDYFPTFDKLIKAINEAKSRENDLSTDLFLEGVNKQLTESEDNDWTVNIHMSHLHPKFGQKSPEQVWKEMEEEQNEEEVDVNLVLYQERKLKLRQSPYPTALFEIRGDAPEPKEESLDRTVYAARGKDDKSVTYRDILKFKAMMGMSSVRAPPAEVEKGSAQVVSRETNDENFYAAIEKSIDTITTKTPMEQAQDWVSNNVSGLDSSRAAFTLTETKHVDEAFEFTFANIAMLNGSQSTSHYMVMPNFISKSGASFHSFSLYVREVLDAIPGMDNISLETFHPDHFEETLRCPVPVLVVEKA